MLEILLDTVGTASAGAGAAQTGFDQRGVQANHVEVMKGSRSTTRSAREDRAVLADAMIADAAKVPAAGRTPYRGDRRANRRWGLEMVAARKGLPVHLRAAGTRCSQEEDFLLKRTGAEGGRQANGTSRGPSPA